MRRRLAHLHDIADDHGLAACRQRLPDRCRQLVMIADNMIDLGHGIPCFGSDLGGAAGDDDPCLRILAAGPPYRLTGLALGLGRHRAGVENDGVIHPG